MTRVGVFGYGSLCSASSASKTVGREVTTVTAELAGWKRRWSLARDNARSEKTFALPDGARPPHILGLNVEPGEDPAGPVNGVVFELTEAELERLDLREMRYDRVDVTAQVSATGAGLPPVVVTYTAKPEHTAPEPPPGAIILAKYAGVVEHAFEQLGADAVEAFRATTGPHPVEVVEGILVEDRIPPGNPRSW